jgi:acetyl-CoA C-acetyltransferase
MSVYIIDAVRTPITKLGGAFKQIPADHLAAHVIQALVTRNGKLPIEEVILGQARQSADAANIARVALLRAKLPETTAAYTVHRQCGSGLQAINSAALEIQAGHNDLMIAGGTESLSTAPYYLRNARYGYGIGSSALLDPNTESQIGSQPVDQYGEILMGVTAENLAARYNISREAQDVFSLRSQELALAAIAEGRFNDEMIPYTIPTRKGDLVIDQDEHPRATTLEKLAQLSPVFKEDGTVTAGSSSGRNDGAAVVLLASEQAVQKHQLQPKARIIAQAVSGVDPHIMGIGPVSSTEKALARAGLTLADIDLIELNEAFAAQALAVIEELNLDINKVNVNGGAIALGHPIGATGAIIMTKLVHELIRRKARYGLATLCIGGGQGITTIIENLQR